MKLLCRFLLVMLFLIIGSTAFAAEKADTNWEISMQPKPSAEEVEKARWSFILQNDFGVYAYDNTSLKLDAKKRKANVLIKTVFTNEDVLKKLNQKYAAKLGAGDKTAYCEMQMIFNIKENTYAVKRMDVFSKKGVNLETKINKIKMASVPEKTFAEAMLKIVTAFATDDSLQMNDK